MGVKVGVGGWGGGGWIEASGVGIPARGGVGGIPARRGVVHSGGMGSSRICDLLRRNDGGGGGGQSKDIGFGIDCLGGAGTIVDCLVCRGGEVSARGSAVEAPFESLRTGLDSGHAIGARHRRTFSIFGIFDGAERSRVRGREIIGCEDIGGGGWGGLFGGVGGVGDGRSGARGRGGGPACDYPTWPCCGKGLMSLGEPPSPRSLVGLGMTWVGRYCLGVGTFHRGAFGFGFVWWGGVGSLLVNHVS